MEISGPQQGAERKQDGCGVAWGWGTSRREFLVKTQPQEVGPIQACFSIPLAALLCAGLQQQGPQNLFCLWPLSLALGLYPHAPLCPLSPHSPCAPLRAPPLCIRHFPSCGYKLQEGRVDLGSHPRVRCAMAGSLWWLGA